jgi:hypothetical protein
LPIDELSLESRKQLGGLIWSRNAQVLTLLKKNLGGSFQFTLADIAGNRCLPNSFYLSDLGASLASNLNPGSGAANREGQRLYGNRISTRRRAWKRDSRELDKLGCSQG